AVARVFCQRRRRQGRTRPPACSLRKRLDQSVLKLEPFEVLPDADALVAAVRAVVVDLVEDAFDAVGRNGSVPQEETVGRAGAHHRDDDDRSEEHTSELQSLAY